MSAASILGSSAITSPAGGKIFKRQFIRFIYGLFNDTVGSKNVSSNS
jgi:hypothetical protein